MLVVQQCGVVEVGTFDVRRRARSAIAISSSTLARALRRSILSSRSRRASVTTRVIVSPVARAIRWASRWASGSLMLRLIRRSLSRLSQGRLPFHSASLASSTSPAGTARARKEAARSAFDPRPVSRTWRGGSLHDARDLAPRRRVAQIPRIRNRSLRLPRVQRRGPRIVEIRDVAGDDDQVMDDRGGRDQAVRLAPRAKRSDPTPFEGDDVSDR